MSEFTGPRTPDWLVDEQVSLQAKGVMAILERWGSSEGIGLEDWAELVGSGGSARRSAIADAIRSGYVETVKLAPKKGNQFASHLYRLHPEGALCATPRGRRTVLYRHFDEHGVLLYVGICYRSAARENGHARHSAWHVLSCNRTEELFGSRAEAAAAETAAINQESPLFNFPTSDQEANLRRTYDYLMGAERGDLWEIYVRGTSFAWLGNVQSGGWPTNRGIQAMEP